MTKRPYSDEPPGDFPIVGAPAEQKNRPHWRTAAMAAVVAGVLTLIIAEVVARVIRGPAPGENAWTGRPVERGYDIPRPEGGFRVMVIGSELAGGAWTALEKRYQDRWTYPYQIIELDASANSPAEVFDAYVNSARQYKPDVLILTISPSDLIALDPELSRGLEASYYGLDEAGSLQTLDVQARPDAGLGRFSALARMMAGAPREETPEGASMPLAALLERDYSDPRYATAFEVFGALVSAINTQAGVEGSQFGVIVVPDMYAVYPEWYFSDYPAADIDLFDASKIERQMIAMLDAYAIRHFELAPYLQASGTEALFQRDQRLTRAGHDVVTEALDNWFSQSGWAAAGGQ